MDILKVEGLNQIQEEWGYRLPNHNGFDWSITIIHGYDASGDNIRKMFWTADPFYNKGELPTFSGTTIGADVSDALREALLAIHGWAKENRLS